MPAAAAGPAPPSAPRDASRWCRMLPASCVPRSTLRLASAVTDATPCAPRLGGDLKTPCHPFTGRSRAIWMRGLHLRPAVSSRCWRMRCFAAAVSSSARHGLLASRPFTTSWSRRRSASTRSCAPSTSRAPSGAMSTRGCAAHSATAGEYCSPAPRARSRGYVHIWGNLRILRAFFLLTSSATAHRLRCSGRGGPSIRSALPTRRFAP